MHDPINPSHYTDGNGVECIEAIESSMSTEEFKGFLKGNMMKYVWRYDKKNGLEDLYKAKWYLERLIGICQIEEAMEKTMTAKAQEELNECPDGFCPLPNVRQGPAETAFEGMFKPVS
jgi:hypothetical protein